MRFSKKIQEINHSPIRKFYKYAEEAKKQGKKVYHLNIGQPDILTPTAFFNAIQNFKAPVIEYMPSQGIEPLISEMKNYYRRIGVPIDEKDILITDGGSEALLITLLCILDEGDEVLIAEPFYSNYSVFIKSAGGKIVPITTRAEAGYHIERKEDIESRITDRTKAMILTNPGNPTGTVLSEEEKAWVIDLAKKYDLYIISDEVYREFIYDDSGITSFGKYDDIAESLVIIDSISKRFSACGSRIGAMISQNTELINNAMKLAQGRLSSPTLDQIGAVELYKLNPSYFDDIKEEYRKRRDTAYDGLCAIEGVICVKPAGAFYITAKLPVENTEHFLIWLLTEFEDNNETVMYAPAEGFYETKGLGKNEIRIAYVLNTVDLKRAMEILKKGLEKYNKIF